MEECVVTTGKGVVTTTCLLQMLVLHIQAAAPSRGLQEAGAAICAWGDLPDTEKLLLPLAPAQFDPHTKSSSNCTHRQLQPQRVTQGTWS